MRAWLAATCVCGGPDIRTPSVKDAAIHVDIHNSHPLHQAWRRMREADVAAPEYRRLLHEYRVSRRPTADVSPVDSVQGEPGASASGNAA